MVAKHVSLVSSRAYFMFAFPLNTVVQKVIKINLLDRISIRRDFRYIHIFFFFFRKKIAPPRYFPRGTTTEMQREHLHTSTSMQMHCSSPLETK